MLPMYKLMNILRVSLKSLLISLKIWTVDTPSEMEYFWKGGIRKLDDEMEGHEMLCSGQD